MKTPKCIFVLARVCKQVISQGSGYEIYIESPFDIETS